MKKTVMVLLLVLLCLCGCGEQSGQKEKQSKKATKEIFAMDTYMTITTYGEKAEEAATKAVSKLNAWTIFLVQEKMKVRLQF